MGWSVKVGAVFPLTQQYASAKVLAAFQLEGRRQKLADVHRRPGSHQREEGPAALDRISAQGGNFSKDDGYTRILADSCPIVEASGRAVAALTVPLVRQDKIPAGEAARSRSNFARPRRPSPRKLAPGPPRIPRRYSVVHHPGGAVDMFSAIRRQKRHNVRDVFRLAVAGCAGALEAPALRLA